MKDRLPAFEDIFPDPDSTIRRLTEEEREVKSYLLKLQQRISIVEKIKSVRQEWDSIRGTGSEMAPFEQGFASDGNSSNLRPVVPGGASRRDLVVSFLKENPEVEMKVREIGEKLGVENLRSLRVLLDNLVKRGILEKTPEKRYRYLGQPARTPGGRGDSLERNK